MLRFVNSDDLENAGWSDYEIVIKAVRPEKKKSDWIERGKDVKGFKLKRPLFFGLGIFEKVDDGIYQFQRHKRVKTKVEEKIVYVGKSESMGKESLQNRIWQYCSTGSHKEDEIQNALDDGYDIRVRVLPEPSLNQVHQMCKEKVIPALSGSAMEAVYLKDRKELYDWNGNKDKTKAK